MKLYYSPLACSLAAHIACLEGHLDVELVEVDLWSKSGESGRDWLARNPMGQVPTLVLEGGRVLTESVAVLTYLSDRASKDASEAKDPYELTRWLSFISTEIHKKVLAPIFAPESPDAVKEYARKSAARGLDMLAARLETRDVLFGEHFTVADAYLFWALTLMPQAGVSLESYPSLERYHRQHRARPQVRAAFKFEKERWARLGENEIRP